MELVNFASKVGFDCQQVTDTFMNVSFLETIKRFDILYSM